MYSKLLLLALAYALVGLAAIQLSVPQALSSLLFPPAGIALAAVLAWGPRALPAVAVGSLLLNLAARWFDDAPLSPFLPVFLLIAVGAALQAALGAWLVRRFVGPSPALDSSREFLRFAVLAGPAACWLNASIGCTALFVAGHTSIDVFFDKWWSWWIGDSIGVLIAAPIALAFIGKPRSVWVSRQLSVAMPLVAAIGLASWIISQDLAREYERRDAIFQREANLLAQSLHSSFEEQLAVLRAIHDLLEHDPVLDRDKFRYFTAHWLESQPGLQALGWSTHVPPGYVEAFEERIRASGRPTFRVFNRDSADQAPLPGEEVVAITYIEPEANNARALGVNVLSIDVPRQAVLAAIRSREPVASGGFRLTQETGDQVGVVLYMAVREYNSTGLSDDYRGIVFATMRMQDALGLATPTPALRLDICLLDLSEEAPVKRLAGPAGCEEPVPASSLRHDHAFTYSGRHWVARITPGRDFEMSGGAFGTSMLAGTSLLTISLFALFLLIISGRTRRIEDMVERRTHELQTEIAERRSKELALQESENRFRKVFDTASVGLVYSDLIGRILRANPEFCRIVSQREEQLIGSTAMEFTHPEDRPIDRKNYARLLAGEVEQIQHEMRYVRPDCSSIPVRVRLTLERDATGRALHVVAVVEDIGEEKRLREAERARQAAEAANRAKDEFLSRMSHDLRTPLNAILGNAQLLANDREHALAAEQAERLRQIDTAGGYLLEMINDVLDLSRLESGTLQVAAGRVDPNALAQDCLKMLRDPCEQYHIDVQLDLAEDAGHVCADATKLKQVITNLLSNAIKYNRPGGSVNIRTQRHESCVSICVSDTGQGMTPAQLAQLFEPFNRLGQERSGTEGTGIGLVIAQHLVELMGGRIEVDSTAGVGSSFTVELPLAQECTDVAEAPIAHSSADSRSGRGVVYCIEDSAANAAVVRGFLAQRPGIDLRVFERGADGLRAVQEAPPDLLLLDINLPDLGGIEILQRLRADPRLAELPVIVLSAGAMDDQVAAAQAAGATGYLTKPLNMAALLASVDEIIAAP